MRTIDADALRERLHEEYRKLHAEYHRTEFPPLRDILRGRAETLLECMDMVRKAPSVDVASVVRCKDCKHRGMDSWCEPVEDIDDGNFFCARGAREDGESDG